jgi:hypothetical protein
MSSHKTPDFLEMCSHLRSEWRLRSSDCQEDDSLRYEHTYSSDLSETKYRTAVSMKELDLYSSREAYTLPFCPRIYKYVTGNNRQLGNELIFDIALLVEEVPRRLGPDFPRAHSQDTLRALTSKVPDIVQGFDYLCRRFGPFRIQPQLIGWTELGVIKVWLNEDYSLNCKEEP